MLCVYPLFFYVVEPKWVLSGLFLGLFLFNCPLVLYRLGGGGWCVLVMCCPARHVFCGSHAEGEQEWLWGEGRGGGGGGRGGSTLGLPVWMGLEGRKNGKGEKFVDTFVRGRVSLSDTDNNTPKWAMLCVMEPMMVMGHGEAEQGEWCLWRLTSEEDRNAVQGCSSSEYGRKRMWWMGWLKDCRGDKYYYCY